MTSYEKSLVKRRAPKILVALVIFLVVIFGGAAFALKTTKNIDVAWKEEDYLSYKEKIKIKVPETENFNIISLSKGKITCNGKLELDVSLTDAEVSSALSKQNEKSGPITDVKVRFIGSNEAEASFKLSSTVTKDLSLEKYGILNNDLVKAAMSGTPIYIRTKVDKASSNSIAADFSSVSIGRIPLSSDIVEKLETVAVDMINNNLARYDNLYINSLGIDEGKLNFKGTIPAEVKVLN